MLALLNLHLFFRGSRLASDRRPTNITSIATFPLFSLGRSNNVEDESPHSFCVFTFQSQIGSAFVDVLIVNLHPAGVHVV